MCHCMPVKIAKIEKNVVKDMEKWNTHTYLIGF